MSTKIDKSWIQGTKRIRNHGLPNSIEENNGQYSICFNTPNIINTTKRPLAIRSHYIFYGINNFNYPSLLYADGMRISWQDGYKIIKTNGEIIKQYD